MRAIVVGDSPNVSTGFGRCTSAICDALLAAQHEPIVLGINEPGDPTDRPYKVFPCRQPFDSGFDAFGVSRLCVFVDRFKPDVVVIEQDGWNVGAYFNELDRYFKDSGVELPPVVGFIAVDSRNQLAKPLNRLTHVMVWTQFGADELAAGGYEGSTSIVPLGVDHEVFYPRDKAEARKAIGVDQDSFIIGCVGRNQPRKRLDLVCEAFHQLITTYDMPDIRLLMHVAPTGDVGCNIRALIHYYGLKGRVLLSEPSIGKGADTAELPNLYSAFDVYLSTSQAEGFGLPALEAMSCGVPCVLPSFAAFGETGWVGTAALQVECTSTALTAPLNTLAYTIGGIPDRDQTVQALRTLYLSDTLRDKYRRRGLEHAQRFSWHQTGQQVVRELERVVEERRVRRVTREAASAIQSETRVESAAT